MSKLLANTKLFFDRNSATILTYIGAAGVVATSVMAMKAAPKAKLLLEEAKKAKGEDLTKLEIVVAAAPAYISTLITGIATITCIFGANTLNKRQQAAITSAYALLDNYFKEYKVHVNKLHDEEANIEEKVVESIAKDEYKQCDILPSKGKELFFDFYSNRYFESTIEDVQRAEYRLNRNLVMRGYVYLNEFYEELGLNPLESGYKLGWSTESCLAFYRQSWIDFTHEKVELEDGLECRIIVMQNEPIIDFERYL